MRRARLVGVVYRKELIDILRDRRTLLATVLIPVVLYPVLMLWVVWASEREKTRIEAETFVVEVPDESTRDALVQILEIVAEQRNHAALDLPPDDAFDIRVGPRERKHIAVTLAMTPHPPPLPPSLDVRVTYNDVDERSRAAMRRFQGELNAFRGILTRQAIVALLERPGIVPPHPDAGMDVDIILNPIAVESTSTATEAERGGWALGQIVPIILVLMMLTGAIYPAIDLTAGERERGTLETLMVTPAPALHLITGKFLVVATVAFLSATLNLASVGATMHFAGITRLMAAEMPVVFPLWTLPVILICMVPLALLFAATLMAVCSFARTFKEAQNYVMPVIIGSLVLSIPVALPGARLEGPLIVLPVGNMVLLVRELLQQSASLPGVAAVVLSTALYAAAAVALATRLFGKEAVVFTDSGSYRALIQRRFFEPRACPTAAQVLMTVAILFPVCFYGQLALMGRGEADFIERLTWLAVLQFGGLFVLVPVALCAYLKVDLRATYRIRLPAVRVWLGAVAIGLSSWALAHEFMMLQMRIMPFSQTAQEFLQRMQAELQAAPLLTVLVLIAIVPAVTEELLFRGFLLSGLHSAMGRVGAILSAALVFGLFHFMIERVPLTFLLGALLGWLVLRSGSILPAILVHAMHNGAAVVLTRVEAIGRWLGVTDVATVEAAHLPRGVVAVAAALFVAGCVLVILTRRDDHPGECVPENETPSLSHGHESDTLGPEP